jgi:SAM-dependent methyltransferase
MANQHGHDHDRIGGDDDDGYGYGYGGGRPGNSWFEDPPAVDARPGRTGPGRTGRTGPEGTDLETTDPEDAGTGGTGPEDLDPRRLDPSDARPESTDSEDAGSEDAGPGEARHRHDAGHDAGDEYAADEDARAADPRRFAGTAATRLVWPTSGPGPYGSGRSDPYGHDPYGHGPRGHDPHGHDPYAADPSAVAVTRSQAGPGPVGRASNGDSGGDGDSGGSGRDLGNGHTGDVRNGGARLPADAPETGVHPGHPHLAEWVHRADRAAERAWSWFGQLTDQAARRAARPPRASGPEPAAPPRPAALAGGRAAAPPAQPASSPSSAPPATSAPAGQDAGPHRPDAAVGRPPEITVDRFPPTAPPIPPPGETAPPRTSADETPSTARPAPSATWRPNDPSATDRTLARSVPGLGAGSSPPAPSFGPPVEALPAPPRPAAPAAAAPPSAAPPSAAPPSAPPPSAAPPGAGLEEPAAGRRGVQPTVGYALHTGEADAHRLATQSRALEPGTEAFLSGLGLGPGWRCLDVGCGHGQVSVLLASRVRPGGRIVGVDGDAASLRVARRNAAQAGARVAFLNADAGSLPTARGEFDLAYCRLLLGHLADPLETLRAMAVAVRPGGVVAVEDVYFAVPSATDGPLPAALAEFFEILAMTVRVQGGDPQIGPRLPALLAAVGLVDISVGLCGAPLPWSSPTLLAEALDAAQAAALAAGTTTAAHLYELRAALRELPPDAVAATRRAARLYQVAGRRPRRAATRAA